MAFLVRTKCIVPYEIIMATYTITFGDVAENHARMQKIGQLHDKGYSIEDLEELNMKLLADGFVTEMVDLQMYYEAGIPAKVLVIRNGVQRILQTDTAEALMKEHAILDMDKKAKMRGKVVNKHARWNLCFDDESQEPDYENGKGRVISFDKVPHTQKLRETIAEWTNDVVLKAEGNYYYDIKKCYIGFHGDAERRKVVAVRMGMPMPLYFGWWLRGNSVGNRCKIVLNDGDMYVMSEKAVGHDWLKRTIPTLRHGAGMNL
jgi:hypothetical protein